MKLGIIDVGGGMRDIYGAGVLDRCMEDGVRFDCCIGVSAGSANLITYLAGQKGRSYRFYSIYSKRRRFMSLANLFKTGSYFDFGYVYCGLGSSDGEDPLDHAAFAAHPADYFAVACEADTGCTRYFTRADFAPDRYEPLSASSCIPILNRPVEIGGICYFDGGICDPIPMEKALAEGCDKIVVILSKPIGDYLAARPLRREAKLLARRYPQAARCVAESAALTAAQLKNVQQLAAEGRALILAPDSTEGVSAISKNQAAMQRLYQKGLADGAAVAKWLG